MATDQASGLSSPEPFAYFDPDSCSWRMCQASLLEASGESCTTWPRQVTWDRQFVWELPTSGLLTDESESSSLLAGALLPTPNASDDKGGEGPTRWARQEEGSTGGPALKDIAHLLPTPTGQDAANTAGPSQQERNTPPLNTVVTELLPTPQAADGHGGRLDNAETTRTGKRPSGAKAELTLRTALTHKMLPTPTSRDHHAQGAGRNPGASQTQLSTLVQKYDLDAERLLPTPLSGDRVGGTGPPSGLRTQARVVSGQADPEAPTGRLLPTPRAQDGKGHAAATDYELGRDEDKDLLHVRVSRLLPTPTSQDSRQNALNEAEAQRNPATMWATMGRVQSGDHTSPRFGGGRQSSLEPHPDQLTLGDD